MDKKNVKNTQYNQMKLPPYSNFPNIKGEKISLRQIEKSDLEDIIEISFYNAVQATTAEIAGEMQTKINNDYKEGNTVHWGIVENSTGKIAGTCGYYRGFENATGELGCVLLPQFRGQGFMTMAMQLAIDFGLNNMGLQRIWAITTKQNSQAISLLERLQFIKTTEIGDDEIEYELRIKRSL
ncbi:GNAT family N-acetyltransferase [Chryseobacterium sp. IHB B 17019]|uniref:GNAT family N-acetyltransferase n=1 Tax=Chryseobacterium sp. IHB B 17019 TaxID=1721091 RepID=UPI000AA7269C|nr:GNAT family N-acetyltransferase [Chryseobacterium sp. IHB B 17019]